MPASARASLARQLSELELESEDTVKLTMISFHLRRHFLNREEGCNYILTAVARGQLDLSTTMSSRKLHPTLHDAEQGRNAAVISTTVLKA